MATDTSSTATNPASGRVDAVFEIAGRGVVVVVGDLRGIVGVGHTTKINGQAAKVAGIEMISPRVPVPLHPPGTGVLLRGVDKPTAKAAIGTRITFDCDGVV